MIPPRATSIEHKIHYHYLAANGDRHCNEGGDDVAIVPLHMTQEGNRTGKLGQFHIIIWKGLQIVLGGLYDGIWFDEKDYQYM